MDTLRLYLRSGFTWRPSDPGHAVDRTVSPLRIAVAALLSRFLAEPAADTPAAQETLHALRRIAGALGEAWPPDGPGMRMQPGALEVDPIPEAEEIQEAVGPRRVVAVLLVPDYAAEHPIISLQFPATPVDLKHALAYARLPEQAARFPHLIDALPQTKPGMGVFVGLPHWDSQALVVCIDATAVDGRVYAAVAPAYADRSVLCDIADLPEVAPVDVFVGVDDTPLVGEAMVHLVAGTTVVFVPQPMPPTYVQSRHPSPLG